jgi:hypothetical protein
MRWLLRHYGSIDPRTLGLVRIAIALLLWTDLIKRCGILSDFYTNDGLLPNHRVLWSPTHEWMFSPLLALSHRHEVVFALALIGCIYTCFLLGYRTRLTHVLSWLSLVALQVRVDVLSNGGDFVFSDLVLWTGLLPLGRRFSLDALLGSLRTRPDPSLDALRETAAAARDTEPVVSLAVLAATLQLSVIYYFNAVHKSGWTWRSGNAVYYMLHQERIVTALGVWIREHVPARMLVVPSYATLLLEISLPFLILSPWGRPWTRRAAIVAIWGLHIGIALLSNLGLFSPVMIAFSLLLLDARDWDTWQAAAARGPRLQLYVDQACGSAWLYARMIARLDLHQRIDLQPLAALEPDQVPALHAGWLARRAGSDRVLALAAASRAVLRVLPAGALLSRLASVLAPLHAPLARQRDAISAWLGLHGASGELKYPRPSAAATTGLQRFRARVGGALNETLVLLLLVVATSQLLIENPAIPSRLRLPQPELLRAAVAYFRLNQGWSMFAPNTPTEDHWVVIDAVTVSGRHVDPLNQRARGFSEPTRRDIPEQLGYSAAWCDYLVRLPDRSDLHDPLRDWISRYPQRTGRAGDLITSFTGIVVEHQSPAPGETKPKDVRWHVFVAN